MNILRRITNKILGRRRSAFNFDATNPLGGGGERVDITYEGSLRFESLDIYQKSHIRRYEFALQQVMKDDVCGDFACGTGYGSAMLATKAKKVLGIDIDRRVITIIKRRYKSILNVEFKHSDLLRLDYKQLLDVIISFETVEHFEEDKIYRLLENFCNGLKKGGTLIFSTPYLQEATEAAQALGFHRTFMIDENRIERWLDQTGFKLLDKYYQNYNSHEVKHQLPHKDFIICLAKKT